jgi:hypothetical protein
MKIYRPKVGDSVLDSIGVWDRRRYLVCPHLPLALEPVFGVLKLQLDAQFDASLFAQWRSANAAFEVKC